MKKMNLISMKSIKRFTRNLKLQDLSLRQKQNCLAKVHNSAVSRMIVSFDTYL